MESLLLTFPIPPPHKPTHIPSLCSPSSYSKSVPFSPKLPFLFSSSKPRLSRPSISPTFSSKSNPQRKPAINPATTTTQDDGIPTDMVKILVKFKSRHNYIRVLEVSRTADHPFRGSRLLLLDTPGNIHSINFLFRTLTDTYFDVFATLPPIIPAGPIGVLGFGAGSTAKVLLQMYPDSIVHGWEIDQAVVDVGREYFGLSKLEKEFPDRLFIYIGNALNASLRNGFSGILVDLFSRGSLLPELQDPVTWVRLRKSLRNGGRIMVNVGGSCVEPEDSRRDGKLVMVQTLRAMQEVFGDQGLHVLSLGNRNDDSSIALTGPLPNVEEWKKLLPKPLKCYADMWIPNTGGQ